MSLFFGKRGEQRSTWVDFGGTSWEVGSRRTVSPDNAPKLAAVFAAQRHIVDYISSLPVNAYRRNEQNNRLRVGVPALLATPNGEGRSGLPAWMSQAVLGLINGNAVGWITSIDDYGLPTDVKWLHWTDWHFDEQGKQWSVKGDPVPTSRILHIPWIVPPGKTLGLSPIEHFAAVIMSGMSAQDYSDIARGGGIPPSILKNTQRVLDADQAEQVKKRAKASFSKSEPFVTGSDWEMSPVAIPPNHAQFVETLKLTSNLVAAIYGIDPTEVAGTPGGSLTYNTEEAREIRRAADMYPYISRLENAFARVLPDQQYVTFDVDARMRVDQKTRTSVIGDKISDGRLSVNEARALEDRPPVSGGDFHNVPSPAAAPTSRHEGEQS